MSNDVDIVLFVLDLDMKYMYIVESGPSTYIYCVVCYHMIAAPCVRRVGCVFAHLYTLVDDLERPSTMS